jgi:MYXO-CTERM domain-containing protein
VGAALGWQLDFGVPDVSDPSAQINQGTDPLQSPDDFDDPSVPGGCAGGGGSKGCGCASGTQSGLLWGGLLGVLAMRRRRRD